MCTLGPASDTDDVVRAIIDAGMDVARLNFSYGDHSRHAARIERVRRIAKEENALVAILGDLQGPKIRVGEIFGGSVQLATGSSFTLTTRAIVGDASAAHIDFADLPQRNGHVAGLRWCGVFNRPWSRRPNRPTA